MTRIGAQYVAVKHLAKQKRASITCASTPESERRLHAVFLSLRGASGGFAAEAATELRALVHEHDHPIGCGFTGKRGGESGERLEIPHRCALFDCGRDSFPPPTGGHRPSGSGREMRIPLFFRKYPSPLIILFHPSAAAGTSAAFLSASVEFVRREVPVAYHAFMRRRRPVHTVPSSIAVYTAR